MRRIGTGQRRAVAPERSRQRRRRSAVGHHIAGYEVQRADDDAVGADHRPWMRDEIGDLGAEVLRAVKAVLDPTGILNPGKLIP